MHKQIACQKNIACKKKVIFISLILTLAILMGVCAFIIFPQFANDKEIPRQGESINMSEVFKKLVLNKSYKKLNSNNALYTQRFGADPGVMVYDGRVYIYMTNDIIEKDSKGNIKENTYGKINTINCISSADLVNWTDHGAMKVAGIKGAAKWATNSWAPCAAHKTIDGKEKFFLYFANGGNGISVVASDTPYGPWEDPIGEALITRNIKGCEDVVWLFDPAILVDDDGSAYLYFGGGIPGEEYANPGTARVVKLGDDMVSLDGEVAKIDVPYLFEDSGINKIGDKYYYSYCSNFNVGDNEYGIHNGAIEYMVSDNPMGPFTYAGEIFENPGAFFGVGGNNHHSIFMFNGDYYLAYHTRTIELAMGIDGNYRSPHIDKLTIKDGVIESTKGTYKGVSQIEDFDPYTQIKATTMSDNGGIEVIGTDESAVLSATEGDWIKLSDVDFRGGASGVTINVSAKEKTYIMISTTKNPSTSSVYLEIEATDGEYRNFTVETDVFKGVKDVYVVFAGDVFVKEWSFSTDKLIVENPPTLKEVFKDSLRFGMCLNPSTIADKYRNAVVANFTSITCENETKPDSTLNKSGCISKVKEDAAYVELRFDACKNIVNYCVENGLQMRYHTLVWQNQTPDWFFYEDYDTTKGLASKEVMMKRLQNYIKGVVSYFDENYPGLVYAIDVVNEAFNGNGEDKVQENNNKWYEIFGSSYVYYAFLYAKEAILSSNSMKDVTLVYNDYNMLYKEKVVEEGLNSIFSKEGANPRDYVDAIGFQGHLDIKVKIEDYVKVIKHYSDLGYEIQITELDIGIPKIKVKSEPTSTQLVEQGKYAKSLMEAIVKLKNEGCNITAITIWGINDANSWRANMDGYNAYALFWDKDMNPKAALRGLALCDDVIKN